RRAAFFPASAQRPLAASRRAGRAAAQARPAGLLRVQHPRRRTGGRGDGDKLVPEPTDMSYAPLPGTCPRHRVMCVLAGRVAEVGPGLRAEDLGGAPAELGVEAPGVQVLRADAEVA